MRTNTKTTTTTKHVLGLSALVSLLLFGLSTQAATITSAVNNGIFATGTTWVGGTAPVSGVDSVIFNNHNLNLFTEFTIASGQSMTTTGPDSGMRIGAGGHLTVATGGTMDLPGFDMPESGAGGHLTIEAGATARVDRYWNDEAAPAYTNEWIADASGVTTFQVDGRFTLRGTNSILDVDLSNYNISNGTTLVLVDYGSLLLQSQVGGDNGWSSIVLSNGWSADLDLTYDQGGGDLGIALINITAPTPEPSTLGLMAMGAALLAARRRSFCNSSI